jgi:hypothetical protein
MTGREGVFNFLPVYSQKLSSLLKSKSLGGSISVFFFFFAGTAF